MLCRYALIKTQSSQERKGCKVGDVGEFGRELFDGERAWRQERLFVGRGEQRGIHKAPLEAT